LGSGLKNYVTRDRVRERGPTKNFDSPLGATPVRGLHSGVNGVVKATFLALRKSTRRSRLKIKYFIRGCPTGYVQFPMRMNAVSAGTISARGRATTSKLIVTKIEAVSSEAVNIVD
jgi:hypothetical protein